MRLISRKFIQVFILLNMAGAAMAIPTLKEMRAEFMEQYQARQFQKVELSKEDWKALLPEDAYEIMWEEGTERAFTGKYNNYYKVGIYRCGSCGNFVFSSNAKFDSGTGWPSYWQPFDNNSVALVEDNRLFLQPRVEVECNRCGAHLGHVFEDGPEPTGLRYCINSLALDFVAKEDLPEGIFEAGDDTPEEEE